MLRYDVKVILNTEVNKEYVNTFDPDAEVDEFCETVDESYIIGDCKQSRPDLSCCKSGIFYSNADLEFNKKCR